MKISEAQRFVEELLKGWNVKKSPVASLLGVYEELGELSHLILQKEGFKRTESESLNVGYAMAEVLFELLKLARDLISISKASL